MKQFISILFLLLLGVTVKAQVPLNIGVQILKAEDARRYDETLEDLIKNRNLFIRHRAALAAGRIGDDRAIPALVDLLNTEAAVNTAAMAAFAIGEIESTKGADAILKALSDPTTPGAVVARAVEAAGKIAAANPKEGKSKQLSAAVLSVLNSELTKQSAPNTEAIRLGLTAVLRTRPAGSEETVRKFLAYTDPNIVGDALNTLARLRAKNANRDARDLLATHLHAIVRANAARVLGAAEDKEAVDVLIKAATSDSDLRVRVSAIRALGSLKDVKAVEALLKRGQELLVVFKRSKQRNASAKNELLELSATIGTILKGTKQQAAEAFLEDFIRADGLRAAEPSIAKLRIEGTTVPGASIENRSIDSTDWHVQQSLFRTMGEAAQVLAKDDVHRMDLEQLLEQGIQKAFSGNKPSKDDATDIRVLPEFLQAYAAFHSEGLETVLREALSQADVFVRATAAELLAESFPSQGNRLSLENAFKKALTTDKHDNDAQLAMLDAMAKINKASALDTIYIALDASDYLVRKKAFELLDDTDLLIKYPGVVNVVRDARARHKDEVLPYDPKIGTKLGQVLNTDADYRRALSRKNGRTKAIVATEKGSFTIDFLPEDAPLTVDNFVKLARSGYFNGLEVHRVVPNFVMQDGDPRGDGNGGPGWSIRCEINMVPYERGAVGMALSGKDTGGSQWFVTHSPQPHLDGGYTVFGRVNETGMKVVDNIVRGDKILSIRIVESGLTQRPQRTQSK